jgi:hypothetical protein
MRVVLRSTPHTAESSVLEFSDGRWEREDWFVCTAAVTVGEEHRSAEMTLGWPFLDDLVGLFSDMERYRHGWTGVMHWSAQDAEIDLDVRNPVGVEATFDVLIRRLPEYDVEWSGSLTVTTDELPRAAEAMRKFVGVKAGPRPITRVPPSWQPL